jgi:hypothetical protein
MSIQRTRVVGLDSLFDMQFERSRWACPTSRLPGQQIEDYVRHYARHLAHPRQGWLLDQLDDVRGKTIGCEEGQDKPSCAAVLAILADKDTDDPIEAAETVLAEYEHQGGAR